MTWSVKVLEWSDDGKHRFEAKNDQTGETIVSTYNNYAPSIRMMMPSDFFALLDRMMAQRDMVDDVTPIEPTQIEIEKSIEKITDKRTIVRWNGWKTTFKPERKC